MKKIFTLVAASFIGASGLMAAPLTMEQVSSLKGSFTPEGLQSVRTDFAKMRLGMLPENGTETKTRSWDDANGNTWGLIMVMNKTPLCELLTFTDENGNQGQYTFEELPMYMVEAYFTYTPKGQASATRDIDLILCWPSKYFYTPSETPENEIDWSAMTLSEMCNNDQIVRLFEQNGSAGGGFGIMNYDSSNRFVSWGIIPQTGNATINGARYNSDSGSTLSFNKFEADDLLIGCDLNASVTPTSGGRSETMTCKYDGPANRVLGFEPTVTRCDNFGQVVVYNAGLINEAKFGDEPLFTEEFPEMTALYVLAGNEGFVPGQVQGGGAFDRTKVGFAEVNLDGDYAKYNCLEGFMFTDPKYAKDITLDPTELRCNVQLAEWMIDPILDEEYQAIAPVMDSFLQGGYNYSWSQAYGTEIAKQGYYYFPTEQSNIAWGTTDGFVANMVDNYKAAYYIKSTCTEIVYYYDPEDITKSRTFKAAGSLESFVNPDAVGVKNVAADAFGAKVIARNGMINVVAGEKAPIAVFTLDGKLVKAAKAAELSVEAPKGMYVVRVGNTAKKVVL